MDESIDELTGNKLFGRKKVKTTTRTLIFPTQKINKENSDERFTSTKIDRGRVTTY